MTGERQPPVRKRKTMPSSDERRNWPRWGTVLVASVVLLTLLLTFASPIRVKLEKRSELVGPEEPVYYMILQERPFPEIEQALRQRPHVATRFVWQGRTLLCYAAWKGREDVVSLLLSMGADPNGAPNGSSPLKNAIAARDPDVVRILLDHGASAFTPVAPLGFTPYEAGLSSGNEQIAALMRQAKAAREGKVPANEDECFDPANAE